MMEIRDWNRTISGPSAKWIEVSCLLAFLPVQGAK